MRRITLTASLALCLALAPMSIATAEETVDSVVATFEGDLIALADGWGEATACTSDDSGTRCYRTETEMDESESPGQRARGDVSPLAVCSTSLRLYSATSFGGSVLQLSTRSSYLNLSSYGFDNTTSSYQIGACSALFFDGANGGAPTYPGATGAGASATSMSAGWDNRVSSVFIA